MSNKWLVIEFDDESAGVIPDIWLHDNGLTASWPPYRTDLQNVKAVQKRQTPQKTWRTYNVQRIFAEAGKVI